MEHTGFLLAFLPSFEKVPPIPEANTANISVRMKTIRPTHPPVSMATTLLVRFLLVTTIVLSGRPSCWSGVIYTNDFENAVGNEWLPALPSDMRCRTPPGGSRPQTWFLGNPQPYARGFADHAASLLLTNLPPHSWVKITFDLYIINSWDGIGAAGPDAFTLGVGGATNLLQTTFANSGLPQSYPGEIGESHPSRTGALETNSLGYNIPDTFGDSVYRITRIISHTSNIIQFDFTGDVTESDGWNETWGIDNVVVETDNIFIGTPTELHFPTLRIVPSNEVMIISWPVSASNFVLQTSTNLSLGGWINDLSPHVLIGDELTVTVTNLNSHQFFRLSHSPIPLFQFAIFYDGLLEFSTSATMNVRGRVHANGSIYTGSSSQLTFYDTVTTAGTISSPANAGGGPSWSYTGTYLGSPTTITNTPVLRPFGMSNFHTIIEMPPLGEDMNSSVGQSRYFNKARVLLLVSNSTATVILKNSPSDNSPITISADTYGTNSLALRTNFHWLSITNLMRDNRENKTVKLTQIDVGLFREWTRTNISVSTKFPSGSGIWPNILYVADNRSISSSTNNAVRLINGQTILTNGGTGFTVATRNPLYVRGHYNAPSTATTNTLASKPASLVSDALTILSANWSDANSFSSYSTSSSAYDAVDGTTINAAIITGVKPSVGTSSTTFSGGVHNLPRLLEDWGSRKLWLNTSLACLFSSTIATNQFQMPNTYYTAPTREFSFDSNFRDTSKLPPGTPTVSAVGN